jgi:hypothetical protein
MSARYLALLVLALLAAFALTALGHRPRRAAPAAAAAAVPEVAITVEVRHDRVSPEFVSVPKDHRVHLTLSNPGSAPLAIRLAGYEDRVAVNALAPGERRLIEFVADRPGGDFTWLIDGRPVGRVAVTGSHLVGDHR